MAISELPNNLSDIILKIRFGFLDRLLPKEEIMSHQPNESDQSYWSNMLDARRFMKKTFKTEALENMQSMKDWFAKLHKVCMHGLDGRRSYSGISGMNPTAGQYRGNGEVTSGVPTDLHGEIDKWRSQSDTGINCRAKGTQSCLSEYIDEKAAPGYINNKIIAINAIFYPSHEDIDIYLSKIWEIAKSIIEKKTDEKELVMKIGQIIQFWASAHPFPGVNHSLIMNFANFLLHEHGYKSVPPTISLWPIAVCLQDGFPEYFYRYYLQYSGKGLEKCLKIAQGGNLINASDAFLPVPLPQIAEVA